MSTILSETPQGIINGSNKVFTVSNPVNLLSLNGAVQTLGVDYTLSSNSLTITMSVAPSGSPTFTSFYLNPPSYVGATSPSSSPFQTVATLVSRITPKLHTGNARTKYGNMYNQIAEASTLVLARIDPPDTIQKQRIDSAIYSNVFNYTCPGDYKGIDRTIDIRPVWSVAKPRDGGRFPSETTGSGFDDTIGTNLRQFDIKKFRNTTTIETIAGVKTLRISKAPGGYGDFITTVSPLNYPDSTISVSGDVTNLVADTLDYIDYNSALSFSLSGSTGQGIITVQLPNGINLSNLVNLGSLFNWFKFANASRFTNLTVKFGSSSSSYWTNIITTPQGRTGMDSNAWDLMMSDWTKSTVTGSPDASQISWVQFVINYTTGTQLQFNKINSFVATLGQAYEIVYYSNSIFKDAATGLLKPVPTSDSDIIQLDPAATTILVWETVRVLTQEQQGKNAVADYNTANYTLEGDGRVIRSMLIANRAGLYRDWIAQNPSQAIPVEENYHEFGSLSGY